MAGRARTVGVAVRLATRYGPQLWVAAQALREPAKEATRKVVASEQARRSALGQAKAYADGSILKVYRGDATHWVVFAGDAPVTVHPAADVPLSRLLRSADLTKRIRTDERLTPGDRLRDAATAALRRGGPGFFG